MDDSNLAIYSNTDITVGFYLIAAAYVLLKLIKQPILQAYLLFSILISLAYWTKYTAIAFMIILWIMLAVYSIFSGKKVFLVVSSALALVLISPHLIRNLIEVGNPLYPSFSSMLGGKGITPWYTDTLFARVWPKPFSTFDPIFFFKLSYLLMPISAVALFTRKRLQQKILFTLSAVYILLWFFFLTNSQLPNTYRYLVPAVVLLTAAVAPAFVLFLKGNLSPKMKKAFVITSLPIIGYLTYLIISRADVVENLVLLGVVFFAVAYSLINLKFKAASKVALLIFLTPVSLSMLVYPVTFSGELFSDVTYRFSGELPLWIDENLPEDASILYFFEYTYLIPRKMVPADDPSVQFIFTNISTEEKLELLRQNNITHIYSYDVPGGIFHLFSRSVVTFDRESPELTFLKTETVKNQTRSLYQIN